MKEIIQTITDHFPNVQAIYLFGSYAAGEQRADSDMDIAILLPHDEAKQSKDLSFSDLKFRLSDIAKADVDLINLRLVSTVFQNEIINTGKRIYCADEFAADEFEALTLSFYQKLNEERAEILRDFFQTNRAYAV
ncbi:MAG: hypothetical protein BWK80_12750 [Desulfobacteraceae bacterium IS3]|jgi:predicted nucleotidyltransferase|nr:MAG: hypothetical protein BWK80_12750 [Desulfobacteraceae bacterium IS3]HAO22803.1 nucleotidyltransferase domain-containing protein [Desulfobacteraceae bacterium]